MCWPILGHGPQHCFWILMRIHWSTTKIGPHFVWLFHCQCLPYYIADIKNNTWHQSGSLQGITWQSHYDFRSVNWRVMRYTRFIFFMPRKGINTLYIIKNTLMIKKKKKFITIIKMHRCLYRLNKARHVLKYQVSELNELSFY